MNTKKIITEGIFAALVALTALGGTVALASGYHVATRSGVDVCVDDSGTEVPMSYCNGGAE